MARLSLALALTVLAAVQTALAFDNKIFLSVSFSTETRLELT